MKEHLFEFETQSDYTIHEIAKIVVDAMRTAQQAADEGYWIDFDSVEVKYVKTLHTWSVKGDYLRKNEEGWPV